MIWGSSSQEFPGAGYKLLSVVWALASDSGQDPGLNQASLSEPLSKLPHLRSHLRGASASPEASLWQELWDTAPLSTQHSEEQDIGQPDILLRSGLQVPAGGSQDPGLPIVNSILLMYSERPLKALIKSWCFRHGAANPGGLPAEGSISS